MFSVPFDNPTTYPGHSGVDFPQNSGTAIPASGKGVVTLSGWINNSAGYGVVVEYENGISVLYCHMLKGTPLARGSRVLTGTTLGHVGSTGNSTGSHLHMEISRGKGAHTYAGIWLHFSRTSVASEIIEIIKETGRENNMQKNSGFYYRTNPNSSEILVLICNTESGFENEYSVGTTADDVAYNSGVAAAFGTGNFAAITPSHAAAIKRSLAEIRKK